MGMRVVYK